MKTKKMIDVKKNIWKTNPFAVAWKKKNAIIANNRMWVNILKANNN